MADKQNVALYCIANKISGDRFLGLSKGEVRVFLSQLEDSKLNQWLVWREDWLEWKQAELIPELHLIPVRELKVNPPPVPLAEQSEDDEALTQIKQLYEANSLAEQPSTAAEVVFVSEIPDLPVESEGAEFVQRAFTRMRKSFDILIDCDGQKFKTKSVDVSVGGLLLKDPLPDWVFGYCTISIIKKNQEFVQLTCSIVENQPPEGRFRVALSPLKKKDDQEKLHYWLSVA